MSRVWIYQADRFLTDQEVEEIRLLANEFVASWTAHGSALAGSAVLEHRLFLILEVDESQAGVTGCSIDKSVHFIKGLESRFNIGFFDRMKIAYIDDAGVVQLVNRLQFEEAISQAAVGPDTIVFNNLVQTKEDFISSWKIPFQLAWHSTFFGRK